VKAITSDLRPPSIILYGASGVGKTSLAATAPRPLFGDSNQGTSVIADVPGLEHLRQEDVRGMDDLDRIFDNLTGTGKKNWGKLFDTVVFDHFDDIQTIIMEGLGDKRTQRDSRKDPDEAEQRDYGIMGNKMRRYLRKFKAVPKVKILICGEVEDRETGQMRPSLVGALKNQAPFLVDHVIYMRIGKGGNRYLHFNPSEDFQAKTRARWLPDELRKIPIRLDDLTLLTRLLALFAAGPKGLSKHAATLMRK
jgi:GTPase SAR1 family protein